MTDVPTPETAPAVEEPSVEGARAFLYEKVDQALTVKERFKANDCSPQYKELVEALDHAAQILARSEVPALLQRAALRVVRASEAAAEKAILRQRGLPKKVRKDIARQIARIPSAIIVGS